MEESVKTPLHVRIPFIDLHRPDNEAEIDKLRANKHPWIANSHFPVDVYQSHIEKGRCKFIIILRNVKDVIVSYYHMYQHGKCFDHFTGSFDEFFWMFKRKELMYGDWLDHSLGWWGERHQNNVLIITYESLKTNMEAEIIRIAAFCDKSKLISSDTVNFIVNQTSFDQMKKNRVSEAVRADTGRPVLNFSHLTRKGIVGDWKNYFNDDMRSFVDENYVKKSVQVGLHLDHVL